MRCPANSATELWGTYAASATRVRGLQKLAERGLRGPLSKSRRGFRVEQVGHREPHFLPVKGFQQRKSLTRERCPIFRQKPFHRDARVHDDWAQRSRSSRIISSEGGNARPDPLIWLRSLAILRTHSYLDFSSCAVGMFSSSKART